MTQLAAVEQCREVLGTRTLYAAAHDNFGVAQTALIVVDGARRSFEAAIAGGPGGGGIGGRAELDLDRPETAAGLFDTRRRTALGSTSECKTGVKLGDCPDRSDVIGYPESLVFCDCRGAPLKFFKIHARDS